MSDTNDPGGKPDASASDPADDLLGGGPAGDLLGDELVDPGPYQVVDPDAEELAPIEDPEGWVKDAGDDSDGADSEDGAAEDSTDGSDGDQPDTLTQMRKNKPRRRVVIDDESQLEAAEDEADEASSTDPVRKGKDAAKPAKKKASTRTSDDDDDDDDEDAAGAKGAQKKPGRAKDVATSKDAKRDAKKDAKSGASRDKVKVAGKKSATPSRETARSQRTVIRRRTSPAMFVRQSTGELRKVIWPTGEQLAQYFLVVLFFVLVMIAFVGGLDVFFGWALLKLFGTK